MRRGALGLLGALLVAPLFPLWVGEADARPHHSRGSAVRGKHDKHPAAKHGKAVKRGKGRRRGGKRREAPPQMPTRIELTAVDLVTGTAHVDVVGTTRPPATRLFILTDQSGRRFVPSFAECYPPPGVTLSTGAPGATQGEADEEEPETAAGPELPATTRWRCSLTIPRLYRRAPLVTMGMEWGNLYVAAPSETVQRLWGEARAAAPLSAIADRHATTPPADLTLSRKNPLSIPETEDPPLDDDPSDTSDTTPAAHNSVREPAPAE